VSTGIRTVVAAPIFTFIACGRYWSARYAPTLLRQNVRR
jgi:hypothetical protein